MVSASRRIYNALYYYFLGPKFVLAYKQCDISISRNNSSNAKNTEMDWPRADYRMEGRRSAYEQC